MMKHQMMFATIFAGCLFAATTVAIRIRLAKVRSAELRTKNYR
ncbi:MAG: hypothetical protein WBM09_01940 [Gallionella sp.]